MKEIYILRHGETEQNVQGIVQGSGINSSLNKNGLSQAKEFYQYYSEIDFDLIIVSNLIRTHQTISHFINERIPLIVDDRIREISWGEHEGKASEPELMEKYYKIIHSWQSGDLEVGPKNGESAKQMQDRLILFIKDLENKPFERALICTHGRTLRALICLLKNWPLSRMEEILHSNTGLYHGIFQNHKWNILVENNLTHLSTHKTNV